MGIQIEKGGILTTVQDNKRIAFQEYGVPPAGAMDTRSFWIANLLVGNDREEAALEMTYVGPQITFTTANCIAITGGDGK